MKILNKDKVKYVIIGAYAVSYYTEPRYTKDLDILIEPSAENAKKIYTALKEFGAPLAGITEEEFSKEGLIYQIGVAPVRVDILVGIKGVEFESIWKQRIKTTFEGLKINIAGLQELIILKKKAKRDRDKRDLKELNYVFKKRKGK
ncbi:MAG: nucleotidyltransferase [Candidatus Omnitrophota bacterium]